ncbi:MAG: hypothetical protein HY862_22105 [Chloroflexi bacterium]|nr:hypothetical protein [Chloroflexota bacterium]
MINLLLRFTFIAFLLGNSGPFSPARHPQHDTPNVSRIEKIAEFGGPIRAIALDGADALIAEGETIVRVPMVGDQAYHPIERYPLGQGPILDLTRTTQALYALTAQSLVVMTPDASQIRNVLPGGGERLTLLNNLLLVTARQAGAKLYAIQPNGDLVSQTWISTPSENIQSAVIDSQTVAMADRSSGIRLLELEDKKPAQFLSVLPTTAPPDGLAIFDHWLFATREHHVNVIDAYNPQNPGVVGHYAPIHDIQDMVRRNGLTLIADGQDGLKVYDNASLTNGPRYLDSAIDHPSYAVAFDASGQYLLSGEPNGLRIYDANRLPDLVPISFAALWSAPTAITVVPNSTLVLVSVGAGGLAVIDIAAPFAPNVRAALPFSGPVEYAIAHPNDPSVLYLTLGDGRLVTLQFDPNAPEKAFITSDLPLSGQPSEMAIDPSQDLLAVATGRAGLDFYALGLDHTQPSRLTNLISQSLNEGGVKSVKLTGGGRWVVLDGNLLRVVRLFGKRQFVEDGRLAVTGSTLALTDQDLLLGGGNQLTTLTLQNGQPQPTVVYHAPTQYHDIAAQLTQVVLAADDGLIILDTTDRTHPHEQRFIATPFKIERLLIRGDDWLLINSQQGMVHMRFSLLLANEKTVEPTIAGTYLSIQGARQLLAFADGSLGLAGNAWFHINSDGGLIAAAPDAPARSSAALGTATFMLQDHLIRLDTNGQVTAENEHVMGLAIASDGRFIWLLGYQGQLQAFDPITLQPAIPTRSANFGIEATTITAADDLLYIGTKDGTVLVVAPPAEPVSIAETLVHSRIPNMGGAVADIYPVPDQPGQIVVSANEGGVWWLDTRDSRAVEITAHSPLSGRSIASATSEDANWLAVANGACGIQVLDASQRDLGLRPLAEWHGGSVTDVQFVNNHLMALVGGVPTLYQLNPTAPPMPPPMPHRPSPSNATESTMPIQTLTWLPNPDPCQQLDFEVWVDGKLMGQTSESRWLLPAPLTHDIQWQIIALDAQGNRTPGPIWHVYAPLKGWANTPLALETEQMKPPTEKSPLPLPFWILGLFFAGLSLLVLGGMGWRMLRR